MRSSLQGREVQPGHFVDDIDFRIFDQMPLSISSHS